MANTKVVSEKKVSVLMDADVHKRLKIMMAMDEVSSISAMIRKILDEH